MSNMSPTMELRWAKDPRKNYPDSAAVLQQKWVDPARPHVHEWRDVPSFFVHPVDGEVPDTNEGSEGYLRTKTTTREHYDKYDTLVKKLGINFPGGRCGALGISTGELRDLFLVDPSLNNIPMEKWDAWAKGVRLYQKEKCQGLSLADLVGALKHAVIYKLLKVEPNFE